MRLNLFLGLLLAGALIGSMVSGPGAALAQEAPPAGEDDWLPPLPDLETVLNDLDCAGVAGLCQEILPQLVYEGRPDSLVNVLFTWEDLCGTTEPMQRTLILGAVWDGAFNEDLYGRNIMDYLIWFVDPVRQEDHRADFRPQLASGDVATEADFTPQRPDFDAFTASLADQLLPHVPAGGLEQFFCLFYAGMQDQAWKMLRDRRLAGTKLQRLYDWEMERMQIQRDPVAWGLSLNYWRPEGNLSRTGQHPAVGLFVEKRPENYLLRLTADLLIGRSRYPYMVQKEDFTDYSNRFNTFTLGGEGGWTVVDREGWRVDLFGGVGMGFTIPFMDQENGEDQTSTVLFHTQWQAGIGCRFPADDGRRWEMGLDLSRQWLGDRNDGGTPLDGQAWAVRMTLARNVNHDLDRRLRVLEW